MVKEITVKNPDHLSKRLWSLKNNEEFCDAQVIVNEERISVHAVVLASASQYFKNIFGTLPLKVVTFINVNKEALKLLIKYCYTGTIKITEKNVIDVLTMAKILSLNFIVETSLKEFESKVNIDDCFSTWKIDQLGTLENLSPINNCVHIDNTLIAVGEVENKYSKVIEIFDPVNKDWAEIEIKCNKTKFSTVFFDNRLLLIGGLLNFSPVETVEQYDLLTGQMKLFTRMERDWNFIVSVHYDGFVYRFSEYRDSNLSTARKLNPITKFWSYVSPMSIARRNGFSAKVLANEIFVVGGQGINGTLDSMEALNPETDKWRKCSSMKEERYSFGAAVVNGFLYVVGGRNDSVDFLNSAEKYDPNIDRWTSIEPLNIGRLHLTAGNLNGSLVVAGGCSVDYYRMSVVEIFDEQMNEWKPISDMKNRRRDFNLIEVPWNLAKQILYKQIS